MDIFWLRDELLSDSDNLPAQEVIAAEIVEDLEAPLEQFREILGDMSEALGDQHECTNQIPTQGIKRSGLSRGT